MVNTSPSCPPGSDSLFPNYTVQCFFSVLLLALVYGDYKFLWVDIGGMGHMSDTQIFNASELKECIDHGIIGLPDPESLGHDDQDILVLVLGRI